MKMVKKKFKVIRPLKAKIDRAINPFDGSRRRLSTVFHKSKKHYSRKLKHKGGAFSFLALLFFQVRHNIIRQLN